jgi:hypothetical protein
MPLAKVGISHSPQFYVLNALETMAFSNVASVGAGVANTTVQADIFVGVNYKISKVAVRVTAIDAVAGGDTFNLVVGGLTAQTSKTYNQNNPAPLDNSYTHSTANAIGADNLGFPTNIAVAGQTVFANDVPFTATNTYSGNTAGVSGDLTGRAQPNTGWVALAASTGGYGIFVPTNYDAVYPESLPLSLRVKTVASTGSITNLQVIVVLEVFGHRAGPVPSSTYYSAAPGSDF